MSVEALRASLPAAQQKHLDPAAPAPARMMAAKGLLPLAPREMVIVLCGLSLDGAPDIASSSSSSLGELPEKVLAAALAAGLPPAALAALAPLLVRREALCEQLLLTRETPDDAVAAVAPAVSERLAEIIAGNQERCVRSPAIVRAIRQNPHLLRSSLDRLFDFLVRSGVIDDDVPEFAEALARLSPAQMQEAAARVVLPADLADSLEEGPEDAARAAAAAAALESKDHEAKERVPLLKLIASLKMSQRVALAVKGNKEARSILIRDMNRVVASAAVRNPRITEQEVASAAQSRSVCDEVIRIIAGSKELSRHYGVKVALVNNPKTPLPAAMRFLTLLRESDVRAVAKSRNVSAAVANQARRLLAAKQGGK